MNALYKWRIIYNTSKENCGIEEIHAYGYYYKGHKLLFIDADGEVVALFYTKYVRAVIRDLLPLKEEGTDEDS